MRQTSCFNCEPVWLEPPARICETLENSQRRTESSLCSRLGSAARTKTNGSVPNCEVESELKVNRCKNSINMSVG